MIDAQEKPLKCDNSNKVEENQSNSLQRGKRSWISIFIENAPLVNDYTVVNENRPESSVYSEMINQPRYVLPHVRRLVPSRMEKSNKSVLNKIQGNSRSRQFKLQKISDENYYNQITDHNNISLSKILIKNSNRTKNSWKSMKSQ